MVQPGDMKEENLIKWLSGFPFIRKVVNEDNRAPPPPPSQLTDSQKENMQYTDQPSAELPRTDPCPPKSARKVLHPPRRSKRLQKSPFSFTKDEVLKLVHKSGKAKKGKKSHVAKKKSPSKEKAGKRHKTNTVHTPKSTDAVGDAISPKVDTTPEGYISLLIPKPPMPLGAKYHENRFIVNEILCYLQTKMDTVPMDVLVKICSDFYPSDEIQKAKQLLFNLVAVPGTRCRNHIGPKKDVEDVRDMIKLLLSAEISDIPIFLALDIQHLPPLNGDCQDISSILRNIEKMQTSIDLLTNSQKDLSSIVHSELNAPLRLRDGNHVESPCDSSGSERPSVVKPTYCEVVLKDNVPEDAASESSLSHISQESVVDLQVEEPPLQPVKSRVVTNSNMQHVNHDASQKPWQNHSAKHQGFSSQDARGPQKETIMVGCGSAPGLQAARRHGPRKTSGSYNRSCTGIFVTNLHPKTSPAQVESFVKRETGHKIVAERLQTKYSSYSSFFIRGDQRLRSDLMDPYLWPADCKVKPYFS